MATLCGFCLASEQLRRTPWIGRLAYRSGALLQLGLVVVVVVLLLVGRGAGADDSGSAGRSKIQRFVRGSTSKLSRFLACLSCLYFPFKLHGLPSPTSWAHGHTRAEPARKIHATPECVTVTTAFCPPPWDSYFGFCYFTNWQGGGGKKPPKTSLKSFVWLCSLTKIKKATWPKASPLLLLLLSFYILPAFFPTL